MSGQTVQFWSAYSPELLAHIVHEKYVNGVPLHRQEKSFASQGVYLSRTTMANWVIHASRWLMPLWQRMRDELLRGPVIHADETVVQVLREPGRKAKSDSRMWVYCSGRLGGPSNTLFEYRPTRSGDHPAKFLEGFSGYLVCDGYDGYNKVRGVSRCGCWAHLRRKFVEALPSDKASLPDSLAAVGVNFCNGLFALERQCKDLPPDKRQDFRKENSKPLVDKFFAWVDSVNPSSGFKINKAIAYAKSEKKYLYRFLESPDIPIDNNRAENAIRPFVIGRKNWLFSDSVKGAQASAIFYSVAASACANGKNIEGYLTQLFKTLPFNSDSNSIQDLLPC